MAQISTIQPQIASIDALWNLFQAQSESVRRAFVKRLLRDENVAKSNEHSVDAAEDIRRLDTLLYGSLHLPEDFDYDKEMEEAACNDSF